MPANDETSENRRSSNGEALDTANAEGPRDQEAHEDFRSDGDDCKAFSTLAATFALAGFQLHRLANGCLLMSRWAMAREFSDSADAARFLRQIGGGHV